MRGFLFGPFSFLFLPFQVFFGPFKFPRQKGAGKTQRGLAVFRLFFWHGFLRRLETFDFSKLVFKARTSQFFCCFAGILLSSRARALWASILLSLGARFDILLVEISAAYPPQPPLFSKLLGHCCAQTCCAWLDDWLMAWAVGKLLGWLVGACWLEILSPQRFPLFSKRFALRCA